MGLLKKLENMGRSVGKIARQAAPVVGLIPGVGTAAGAAIGGLGSLAEGRKFSDSLKSGVAGAMSGYGGSKLRAVGKAPTSMGSLLSKQGLKQVGGSLLGVNTVGSSAHPSSGGIPEIPDFQNPFGGLDESGRPITNQPQGGNSWLDKLMGGGIGGALKKVGGAVQNHGDQLLGGAALAEAYKNSRKADDYRKQGLNFANDAWKQKGGLRKVGLEGMMNEQRPDLSSTFADPNNPYRRVR